VVDVTEVNLLGGGVGLIGDTTVLGNFLKVIVSQSPRLRYGLGQRSFQALAINQLLQVPGVAPLNQIVILVFRHCHILHFLWEEDIPGFSFLISACCETSFPLGRVCAASICSISSRG